MAIDCTVLGGGGQCQVPFSGPPPFPDTVSHVSPFTSPFRTGFNHPCKLCLRRQGKTLRSKLRRPLLDKQRALLLHSCLGTCILSRDGVRVELPMYKDSLFSLVDHVVNVASVPQRSPFRYPGGKTWLVPYVRLWLSSITPPLQELIEPFAGGRIGCLSTRLRGRPSS